MRRHTAFALSASTLLASQVMAIDVAYQAPASQTVVLTGGYGAVGNSSGTLYSGGGSFSYDVILDSGSSGMLMSKTVQKTFGVPLITGAKYVETGIGGSETENVTQSISSYFAPITSNGNKQANFTQVGTYNYEARRKDPLGGLVFYDIVGSPVIQSRVMQVFPQNISDQIAQGFVANIASTNLLPTMPTNLPSHGVFTIPVQWQNFVSGNPVPSEGNNPVVPNVSAQAVGQAPVQSNWLVDSGASFSIVSPTYAAQLGIDMSNPLYTIQGQGVGNSIVTFYGYQLKNISLPMSNGDELTFNGPIVYVPQTNNLPSSITGILGENLWMQNTNSVNPNTGEAESPSASLFQQWYLNGPGSQLVLVDPNNAYVPSVAWANAGSGNWGTAGNWTGSTVPSGAGQGCDFGNSIGGSSAVVTINTSETVGTVAFTNTTGGIYTIAATGGATLTIDDTGDTSGVNPAINVVNGNSIITAPVVLAGGVNINFSNSAGLAVKSAITGTGPITVNGTGTLTIGPGGVLPVGSSLAITAGAKVALAASSGAQTVAGLTIDTTPASELDITNNAINITYTGASPLGTIQGYIATGYRGGTWTGNGIVSSLADGAHGVGYADNGAGMVTVRYTFYGDANLDGSVNFSDLLTLANNYGITGATWGEGDFNYDGTVNFTDLLVMASNYGLSLGPVQTAELDSQSAGFAGDWNLAMSEAAAAVPEPGAGALLVLGAMNLLGRRRRPIG